MATEDKQIQYSPQVTPRSAAQQVGEEQTGDSPSEVVNPEEQEGLLQSEEPITTEQNEVDLPSVAGNEVELPSVAGNEVELPSGKDNEVELPSVAGSDVQTPKGADDHSKGDGISEAKEQIKLVLPSVAGLVLDPEKAEVGNDELAESVILDDDDDSDDELRLPRIEVVKQLKPSEEATGIPTWNGDAQESYVQQLSQKPRREIIAENAHPKCFGNVGASGLSRVFTSGSFCPELSIRAMAPKFPSSDPPLEYKASLPNFRERSKPERSRTIPDMPRKKRDSFKMPEIRSSKVSLFSRDGERAKNLQFGPASTWNLDRSRTDATGSKSRLREKLQDELKRPESESDELTPSESGEMGQKIHHWFKKDRKKDQKNNGAGHGNSRNSKHSKNIWDAGIQSRVHRGLASSVLKPNESIGNYLNDVTSSRFPQVETRQITVSTKS